MLLLFLLGWLQLPTVNVTAQSPEQQAEGHSLIYTVSGQELQYLPIESVNDLFTYLPSIDLRTRGGNGVQADLSINGSSFDQVAVYINGVNLSDPQTGHYALNIPISVEIISQVEVRQGAINIITRPRTCLPDSIESHNRYTAELTGGRFGLWNTTLTGQWQRQRHWHVASAQYNQSNGYISNTDYRIANLYYAANVHGVELQAGSQYKDAGANSFYSLASQDQFDATRTAFLTARYQHRWDAWGLDAQASYRANYDRYEWHRGQTAGGNKHLSQTAAASVWGNYKTAFSRTEVGVELRNENILSTGLGDSLSGKHLFPLGKNRLNINYSLRQAFNYEKLNASIGAQGSWNNMSGNHWRGDLSLSYRYAPMGQVSLNVLRSLRLPSFTDLYYHAGIQRGDVNLLPERSWTLDLGTQYTWSYLTFRANGFYRFGRDIIDWQLKDDGLYYATNISGLDAAGCGLSAMYKPLVSPLDHISKPWITHAEVSYAYNHLFLNNVDLTKSMYLDYLSHKLVVRLDHRIYKGFGASWSLTWQNREGSYTKDGQVLPYEPVWLLDGNLFYQNSMMYISLGCTNMTNAKYYCYGGIVQPGISPKATIKVTL